MRRPLTLVLGALLLCAAGCEEKKAKVDGTLLARGDAADLRLTPSGAHALYLLEGQKPRVEGVPAQMLVGELWSVPTAGGEPKKLANGVTNVPGGYVVSADSRWVLTLSGYNPVGQTGTLLAHDLTQGGEPSELARDVSYMLVSPDSKQAAFIADGVLHVGPLPNGPFHQVSGEVHTAGFTPDGQNVVYRRRLQAAGGFFLAPVGGLSGGTGLTGAAGKAEPIKLGEQVGDFMLSSDSKHVAFSQRSPTARGTWELFLASAPDWKVKKVAVGVGQFGFSSDARYLARTENETIDQPTGDLFVGPADGGEARKVGTKVEQFTFSPDDGAIAYLELYDMSASAGVLGVATLPSGEPKRIGNRVPNYGWSPDGKSIAFISRFLKPMYTVDLMLYGLGDKDARKVHQDVFAYSFDPKGRYLLYRSNCTRNARSCNLYQLELGQGGHGAQHVKVQSKLRALHTARKEFATAQGKPANAFTDVAFEAEPASPYTFCIGKACVPCTAPDCEVKQNPCEAFVTPPRSPEQPAAVCAFAQLDDDAALDVWVLQGEGGLAHVENDQTERILEGVYSFRIAEGGERILVTHARMDSKLYDLAVYNQAERKRNLVAQHIQLPAQFADESGERVVFMSARQAAPGVYASTDVP